ncbi:EamA family transporter [Limobrevibacterium gyesilva]|uniref:EamA family transporter n=1 Tax=Limobrevibacterium gyesilva TaxID=2991712 RepID=A0AA41YPC1_9PROT|nr:EamA family transporter [Limobrevibacterium gyesilva]MCW3473067.1 EamA family transporter [Limobrevibacterium gyesilva]
MDLWIPITLTAALVQTWRTALQQKLRSVLSVNAAGVVRYMYAIPTGILMLAVVMIITGKAMPDPNWRFLFACVTGGLLQIFGTSLLIMAFGFRSFAVGTAYAKTEAVQGAIAAWILLDEVLTLQSWIGIGIGVGGVLVLSLAGRGLKPGEFLAATFQPAALCGLGAGFCFALTSICIKEANRALGPNDVILQAVFSLVITNVLQTLMQGSWLAWREPAQLRATFTTWRSSAWVGTLSALGSACWWTAFALAPVALVRSVGQVEMVFTLIFSRFYLKEKTRRWDVAGLVLVVGSVVLILSGR